MILYRAFPALLLICAGLPITAQRLSFGVIGGTSATGDFQSVDRAYTFDGTLYVDRTRSAGRSLIVGPTVELEFGRGWSFEANALRRPLGFTLSANYQACAVGESCTYHTSSWEFPLLAKYRLPVGKWQPFVAAGPSFRTTSNPVGTQPSAYGVTAEGGIELFAGAFRIAPAIRYTRWGEDGLRFRQTARDQVEALVGFRYATDSASRRPFGRKIWLGAILGRPLTNDFAPPSSDSPGYTGDTTRTADFRFAAGLTVEAELARGLSLEMDGLYRRLHFPTGPEVVVTWEIPVLAKYTFGRGPARPFLEAGPSFRPTGNRNSADPAHVGLAIGGGVDARARWLRVTPSIRYTRWAADSNHERYANPTLTKRDQVELLVGFTF